jgi:hypothetical protein
MTGRGLPRHRDTSALFGEATVLGSRSGPPAPRRDGEQRSGQDHVAGGDANQVGSISRPASKIALADGTCITFARAGEFSES